jgi:3-isopropylmalate/(R)-2-methylmalate dehydratase large subunit
VLTNMTVEGGLMTGVVEPCQPIATSSRQRRGLDPSTAMLVYPDPGATYARVIDVDLAEVPLTVATPATPATARR